MAPQSVYKKVIIFNKLVIVINEFKRFYNKGNVISTRKTSKLCKVLRNVFFE